MQTNLTLPQEILMAAPDWLAPLAGVQQLFNVLAAHHIRYCHWKSNVRLRHGMCGMTDLDLLVTREQASAFKQILYELGIKPVHAAPGRNYPAIENYLGMDETTGRLFHLHVHYQLVLGEQFIKNYRLPLEDHFLNSVQPQFGVMTPSPELEIIVLSIRILLKYRERNLLRDILPFRSSGISADFRKELQWLMEQTNRERILQTLEDISKIVPRDIVTAFLDIAMTGKKAGFDLYFLRNRLRRTLNLFQRSRPFSTFWHYLGQLWTYRKFLRSSAPMKMTPIAGGLTFAMIGADGAGKSTLCKSLVQWLSWKMDVHVHYLGSKQSSRRSQFLYLIFRFTRRLYRIFSGLTNNDNFISRQLFRWSDIFLYSHYVSLGRDRYQQYLAGMQKSANGSVVIFDRYPLEAIDPHIGAGQMDGAKIPAWAGKVDGRIAKKLGLKEKAYYEKIRPPDYLAILNVSPEVSLQRKPDHKQEVVEAKSQLIRELTALAESEANGQRRIHLDADQSFEDIFLQLKTKVWEIL